MSWEPTALTTPTLKPAFTPTLLLTAALAPVFSAAAVWWSYADSLRRTYHDAAFALVYAGTLLADPHRLLELVYSAGFGALTDVHVTLFQHFKMVLTLGAVVWLLNRSWQTLWKPVPDLINILGVDVPEPPDVSLAGIRADAATLSWTRPSSNRPVQKYSIQVNGVHVGDSLGNEVAITVTGLKPSHFYNIRVVAVGLNNFRAGSPVIRLRTFGKDGKPQLGNSRLPTNFTDYDQSYGDESDGSDAPRQSIPSVEAAPVLDGNSASTRDTNGSVPGRRNTINRRHSPSVASMDQPHMRPPLPDGPELSLDELNRKFEIIRKEIDDTLSLYGKDEAELQQQEEDLKKEKDRKRQALKEKEEQTTQLKAMVRTTMEQMRVAEKERSKREQQLKDKEAKKTKVRDNIAKFENEIERMKKERQGFEAQKKELQQRRDCGVEKLDEENDELQDKCAELEAELKDKGKQLQDLKEAREQLPGADDEQWKDDDVQLRREWESKRKDLHNQLVSETKKGHQLDQHIRVLSEQLSVQSQSGLAFYDNHGDPSNVDFEPPPPTQPDKRLSNNSTSLAGAGQFSLSDPNFSSNAGYSPASFYLPLGTGAFSVPNDAQDHTGLTDAEAEIRATSGPMSPSMAGLLPSFLLHHNDGADSKSKDDDDDDDDPIGPPEDDPQSPASSRMSFPNVASPYASSQNLPFPSYVDQGDRGSIVNSSPAPPPPSNRKLDVLLSAFHLPRGTKATDDTGPLIGSLKSGQSQSFPRGTDESEMFGNKRRMSFSWMNRNPPAADDSADLSQGSRAFLSRRIFGTSGSTFFSDRDRQNSRPVSIASTDLPRPSTDSSSIWGPSDASGLAKYRLWSTGEGARWPSRNPSRRPSQHGSPSALTTTLASAEDEILDERDLLDPQTSPSQVGVIGSRPPGNSKAALNQRLNPTAPLFSILQMERESEREAAADGDNGKGREKNRVKEKKDSKGKGKETATLGADLAPSASDDSPSDSRMSRDTYSVHTLNSVSESHDSLPLDTSQSNTPSDLNVGSALSAKDQENVVKKLFRKGSSSKFSLSSRLSKDSSLFKKGPGSTTTSEKTMSADHRSSIGDLDDLGEDVAALGRSYDSVTSSPSLGPSRSKDPKEGRMTSWRFSVKKKGKDAPAKEKESLDMERSADDD